MAISVFDMFKIGIGPSSSHTVGPMRAGAAFVAQLRTLALLSRTRRVEVRLYGSLSATGVGHGSDRAVVMGLMGELPDTVDLAQMGVRLQTLLDTRRLPLAGTQAVDFDWATDMRLLDESLPYHPNGMSITAFGDSGELHEETYYSVGGGFIVGSAQAASGVLDSDQTALPYDFASANQLMRLCERHRLRISDLMLENEKAWRDEARIRADILLLWQAMQACVDKGLRRRAFFPEDSTCAAAPTACTAACSTPANPT
jgi:L-serine dehydratase